MKFSFPAGLLLGALLGLGTAAPLTAQIIPTLHKIAGPKSVFEDPRTKRGYIDPFFPKRIEQPVVAPTPDAPEVPKAPEDPCKDVVLKGVSVVGSRRLALINSKTFTVGETGRVKIGTATVTLTVLEIKDNAAVIQCEGATEPKEIYLKQ